MPRPMEVPGKPATANLNMRVPPGLLAYLDSVRGPHSRGKYVRDLIRADAKKKGK